MFIIIYRISISCYRKGRPCLINSDDLYVHTHDKPQLCPRGTTIPKHYTVVPNFVSKFGLKQTNVYGNATSERQVQDIFERKKEKRKKRKRRIYL